MGESALFALTDTATPAFLSQLYSMPLGLTVHYGANQSVAEFYKEVYRLTFALVTYDSTKIGNIYVPTSAQLFTV